MLHKNHQAFRFKADRTLLNPNGNRNCTPQRPTALVNYVYSDLVVPLTVYGFVRKRRLCNMYTCCLFLITILISPIAMCYIKL